MIPICEIANEPQQRFLATLYHSHQLSLGAFQVFASTGSLKSSGQCSSHGSGSSNTEQHGPARCQRTPRPPQCVNDRWLSNPPDRFLPSECRETRAIGKSTSASRLHSLGIIQLYFRSSVLFTDAHRLSHCIYFEPVVLDLSHFMPRETRRVFDRRFELWV